MTISTIIGFAAKPGAHFSPIPGLQHSRKLNFGLTVRFFVPPWDSPPHPLTPNRRPAMLLMRAHPSHSGSFGQARHPADRSTRGPRAWIGWPARPRTAGRAQGRSGIPVAPFPEVRRLAYRHGMAPIYKRYFITRGVRGKNLVILSFEPWTAGRRIKVWHVVPSPRVPPGQVLQDLARLFSTNFRNNPKAVTPGSVPGPHRTTPGPSRPRREVPHPQSQQATEAPMHGRLPGTPHIQTDTSVHLQEKEPKMSNCPRN